MRLRLFMLPLTFALLLCVSAAAFSNEGIVDDSDQQEKRGARVFLSPLVELREIFDMRRELNELKVALAEKQREKEIVEKSYETFAKEANLERKRAEEIEKNIESQNALLKTVKGKEARKETKQRIKKLQEELTQVRDRSKLAVSKTNLEIKKAEDIERKIKLIEEKIEQSRSKVEKEIKDLYPLAGKTATYIFFVLAVILIRIVLLKLVNRYVRRDDQKYYYSKIVKIGSWTVMVLFIFFVLIGRLEHFMLLISFLGAGVAIALRDVITSFVAWFFIIGPNGFRAGDRIELGDVRGDVIDVGLFRSTLMEIGRQEKGEQSAGRIATFPNHLIFSQTLYNYTTGYEFLWNEVSFLITFESNWRKAEEIILNIAREGSDRIIQKARRKMKTMSRKYMVRFGILTPAVYVRVADSGMELTVRYLTAARMRRVSQDRISRAIVDAINAAGDIDFAYPTIRYYKKESP